MGRAIISVSNPASDIVDIDMCVPVVRLSSVGRLLFCTCAAYKNYLDAGNLFNIVSEPYPINQALLTLDYNISSYYLYRYLFL